MASSSWGCFHPGFRPSGFLQLCETSVHSISPHPALGPAPMSRLVCGSRGSKAPMKSGPRGKKRDKGMDFPSLFLQQLPEAPRGRQFDNLELHPQRVWPLATRTIAEAKRESFLQNPLTFLRGVSAPDPVTLCGVLRGPPEAPLQPLFYYPLPARGVHATCLKGVFRLHFLSSEIQCFITWKHCQNFIPLFAC